MTLPQLSQPSNLDIGVKDGVFGFQTAPEKSRRRELARAARAGLAMQRLAPKLSNAPPLLSTASGFKVESVPLMLLKPRKEMEWVLQDLLVAGTVSTLVALPGVGESAFARHLACCVVNGTAFLDKPVKVPDSR